MHIVVLAVALNTAAALQVVGHVTDALPATMHTATGGYHLSDWAWMNSQTPDHLLLHSESQKLLFCMIPKNACTEFLSLVMRLDGFPVQHWNPTAYKRQQLDVHYDTSRESLFFKRSERSHLQSILRAEVGKSPWVRAVVLRDPAERLLSAYYSKVARGYYGNLYPKNLSLGDFVSRLEEEGLNEQTDPHFRPQSYLCGLNETLEQFDIIGDFNNLQAAAQRILTALPARPNVEEILMHGWGPNRNMPLFGVSREAREQANVSSGSMMPVTHASWQSQKRGGTQQATNLLAFVEAAAEEGTTRNDGVLADLEGQLGPELRRRVERLYAMDYELLRRSRSISSAEPGQK